MSPPLKAIDDPPAVEHGDLVGWLIGLLGILRSPKQRRRCAGPVAL
jgi:hypothetical protein